MTFRNALPEEAGAVYALYQSLLGSPFCVWNGLYPGREEIRQDLKAKGLYVLEEQGRILGAISVVPENELDSLSCWTCREAREIARVAVAPDCRGRGLALEMVRQISALLQSQGCKAIHLSVAKGHIPACKTYAKAGFLTVGEAQLYGNRYDLMEKFLSKT